MIKSKVFLSTVLFLMTMSMFNSCGVATKKVITSIPEDTVEKNSDKIMQEGKKAYLDNKEDEAIKLFEEAIAMGNSDAMYILGVVYLYKGNMKTKGIKLLKQSSDLGNQKAIQLLEKLGANYAQ